MEKICVAIRIKPTSRQETSGGAQWKVAANSISLQSAFGSPVKGQAYAFDKIFGTSIRNAEIYEEHAKDLVLSAVSGFNGTVFAYGQTSSGKTYTMQGSASDQGVTRLAIQDVFTNIEKIGDREFLVRVSYMEIYNEEINDLLAPENRKLQVHESVERGIFVAGLREEIADSVEQVIAVLERGEAQRHFAETDMNDNSSRSHTIFRMVIESRDKSHDSPQDNDLSAQDAVRVSALNLVDLAGSERISKTGAEGVRLKEGAHINKSLTTLGIVINKLSEGTGKQGAHIPYRDSKLTRILQLALGGNARTAIICTINPDEIHIDETRSTLQFASRAKRVTTCAQVNEILTDAALLKRQKEEIEELRRRLEESPHSEDLKKEILLLRNDLLQNELGRERLELELRQELKAQVERERRIREQEQRIANLSTMVISGATDDHELPIKKGCRRETWCPKSFFSISLEQDFQGINSGRNKFNPSASIDGNLLRSAMRRERTFGLPPAFESLINDESDSFSSNSSGEDSLPASADFQNFADEGTWASLNRDDPQESSFVVGEDDWGNMNKFHVSTDSQLKPMDLQYQDLHSSTELKVQEKYGEAVAIANYNLPEEKSRVQLQEIFKLKTSVKDLEVELENYKLENNRLRAESVSLRNQLLHTRAAHEQRVQERVSVDDKNGYFKQRLRSLEMKINDDRYPQVSGACCYVDDLAHDELKVSEISGICAKCQTVTDFDRRRTSLQFGVVNSSCIFKRVLSESQNRQESELSMPTVYTRPFFDEKNNPTSNVLEEKGQHWDEPRMRFVHGNAADTDGIPAALGHVFCRAKQLSGPRPNSMESGSAQGRASDETKNLKTSLDLVNRLAEELLQGLHRIVNHDIRCLVGHLASNGVVGRSVKTLYLLLQENAEVGLRLFYNLSSMESSLAPHKVHLFLEEVGEDGAIIQKNGTSSKCLLLDESVFSEDVKAVRDSAVPSLTSKNTVDDVSSLSSQDPGEDICNIDLHQDCDEGPLLESNCHPSASSQMVDEPCSQIAHKPFPNVPLEENYEELNMMQNMSEAERQFTTALLNKVKALEARLTIAEMEIVDYKVEIVHLRMNKLEDSQQNDDSELEALRAECETQKEEIRQLLEQVMTPDDELERESFFQEILERNEFLESCLKEAEARLIWAKGWREELLEIRETESQMERAYNDLKVKYDFLEKELVLSRQEGSKIQSAVSKSRDPSGRLEGASKSEMQNDAESLNLPVIISAGTKKRDTLSTPTSKILNATPAHSQDETKQPKGPSCRPRRPALGEISRNLLQSHAPNDVGGYFCQPQETKTLCASGTSDKENQSRAQALITAIH